MTSTAEGARGELCQHKVLLDLDLGCMVWITVQ